MQFKVVYSFQKHWIRGLRSSRAVVHDVLEGAEAVSRQLFPSVTVTLAMLLASMIGAVLLDMVTGMVGAMGVFGMEALGMVLWMELSRLGRPSKVAQIP